VATFAEILRARAGDHHVGLRFEDRSWTWDEVVHECAVRAAVVGDWPRPTARQVHIGVLLDNVPDFVFWLGGAALAGAVVVGINPTRRGEELAHDIRHADVDVIVTEDKLAGLLDGIDHGVPAERVLTIESDDYRALLGRFSGAALPERLPPADDVLVLTFSSGSTGAPKAVICSQGRFGNLAEKLQPRTELRRDSVTYLCMPLFHGNATLLNLAPATFVGATVCLARKFSASGFLRDIHRYGATYVNYVGRALSYVLAQPESPRDAESALELAMGTEASAADVERFQNRFGCRVKEGYGLSEGVLRINRTLGTPADSLGLPVEGADVRVMDEATGLECPPARIDPSGRLLNAEAAIGQIVGVGMAHLFEGYYNNPGAMADRIHGDDFWTGDLAYRDGDGFFYFAGRSSDWLRVDSENFSATPVERVLQRNPDVEVALIYAVPDSRTGDQVMCTVQMAPGVEFDPKAFGRFIAEQPDMGPKWWPRYVRVVDEVPMTGSNKAAKTGLRREAWQTTAPVYVRDGAASYRPMEQADRDLLAKEFAEHGRTALLPAAG
jgi:fatty-acyl-CoA synthase